MNQQNKPIGEIVSNYDKGFLEAKDRRDILITDATEQRLKTAGDHIKLSRKEIITTYDGIINILLDEFWSKPVDFSKSDRLY